MNRNSFHPRWCRTSKDLIKSEESRTAERDEDFLRAQIIQLHGKIKARNYTTDDLERLGEFLKRATDTNSQYVVDAQAAYQHATR